LIAANVWQLTQEGIKNIEIAPFCTSCQVAEFYSHRKEQGRTGRFAVLIGL
jgi:copper oxidase (laccase) domain-containing protein